MKYLGVGGSRADVMVTVSALPGAEGILLGSMALRVSY